MPQVCDLCIQCVPKLVPSLAAMNARHLHAYCHGPLLTHVAMHGLLRDDLYNIMCPPLSFIHPPCPYRQALELDTTTGGRHSPSCGPGEEGRESVEERREERKEGIEEDSANPGMYV